MVRAKFRVTTIEENKIWSSRYNEETKLFEQEEFEVKNIGLQAVTDNDSEENKAFFKATPSGQILLNCVNEDAAKQFIGGKNYYVDFTEVD
jgi:hypothetical protein